MHRELGLLVWGSPQEFDVPDYVGDMLYEMFELYGDRLGLSENEYSATYGYGFPEDRDLTIRSYDWGWDDGDGDMLPNVEFKNVRIWWYKYLGRSMTTDRELSDLQWMTWLSEVLAFVRVATLKDGDA